MLKFNKTCLAKSSCLPEAMCSINTSMTFKDLKDAFKSNRTVTALVTRLDPENRCLDVTLGNGVDGIIPFEESSIYPIYKEDGSLSPNIYKLVGNTIQAKILHFSKHSIILSRKNNMLEALKFLKDGSYVEHATIVGFSKMSAFIDIGAGIIGRSYGKDFSNVFYSNIRDLDVPIGCTISVRILSRIDNHFELSRVETLPLANDVFKKNDIVSCKVFGAVNDEAGIGYFVGIHNNLYCGIVDSPFILKYGDKIVAVIKNITPKGIKLDLLHRVYQ